MESTRRIGLLVGQSRFTIRFRTGLQLRLTAVRRSFSMKIDKEAIHMDGLWIKSFASFVKMKVRKGMASRELWQPSYCKGVL